MGRFGECFGVLVGLFCPCFGAAGSVFRFVFWAHYAVSCRQLACGCYQIGQPQQQRQPLRVLVQTRTVA